MPAQSVVLDTNIVVAAGFKPQSSSGKIVAAVEQGRLRMVWSEATRREIERVLGRIPPLRNRAPAARLFRTEDQFTGPALEERFGDIPDPDDRKFAALAHAAGAVLISNDEHLLAERDRTDLVVLTPGEYWRRECGLPPAGEP